jgi:hypothetical protein
MYGPLLLASKPNPSDYPIAVHVQCSYLRGEIGPYKQRIGVSLDGKPVELTGYVRFPTPLPMGDYKARFIKGHGPHAPDFYELLLPDGKTTRFSVSGFGSNVCSVPPQ